ncbi:MAG TPA: hypothetical protein VIK87_06445 [Sphingomonadales bacterium]
MKQQAAALPIYMERLLEGFENWTFRPDRPLPATVPDLERVAPGLAALVGVRPKAEQEFLFRCLGEAEASLLYDHYDALVRGKPLGVELSRRLFLKHLRDRLRRRPAPRLSPLRQRP